MIQKKIVSAPNKLLETDFLSGGQSWHETLIKIIVKQIKTSGARTEDWNKLIQTSNETTSPAFAENKFD